MSNDTATLTRPAVGAVHGARSSSMVPYVRLVHAECPIEEGAVVELEPGSTLVVGRSPGEGRTLQLPDGWMSRQHARLTGWTDGERLGVRVEDLGSRNGSFVEGRQVKAPAVAPVNGVIQLGSLSLVVGQRSKHGEDPVDAPAGFSCLSWPMRMLWRRVERLAESDASVLLLGELGTGKTRVARILHDLGQRRGGPFVAHNCSAIPINLEEATLFGVVGGFIPSVKAQDGLITRAKGGTLFLDELGDMPPLAQAKLLDAFDPSNASYLPVGATQRLTTDCRLVSATNRDVFELAASGLVRQDLLSRLVVGQLEVPPLRQRREDLLPMFRRALRAAGADLEAALGSAEVVQALLLARWTENVRGLESLAQRVALGEALSPSMVRAHADRGRADSEEKPTTEMAQAPTRSAMPSAPVTPPWPPEPDEALDLLARNEWSVKDAAETIGVRRETLSRHLSRTFGKGGKQTVQNAWRVWKASGRAPVEAQIEPLFRLFCEQPPTDANAAARAAWIERGELP